MPRKNNGCKDVLKGVETEVLKLVAESQQIDREIGFYIVKENGKHKIVNVARGTPSSVNPRYPDIYQGREIIAFVHTHPHWEEFMFSAGDVADPDIVQCLIMPVTGEMKCVQWLGTGPYPRDVARKEENIDIEHEHAWDKSDKAGERLESKLKQFHREVTDYINDNYEVVCHSNIYKR